MIEPVVTSHWDYFHLLGSLEDKQKFNYAVKLYFIFASDKSDEGTREYILSRTIQALGALSNGMRAGAFSLFSTLLNGSPHLCQYETVSKLMKNHLFPSGTMKTDAEAYVGQMLAYKAIVESKFVATNPSISGEIANGLMELCTKKSYLHSESLRLLGHISEITAQEFFTDEFLKHLKNLSDSTVDKLQYLLKLDTTIADSETVSHVFDSGRLISPESAPEIGILLSKCHLLPDNFINDFVKAVSDDRKYISKFFKSYEQSIKDKLGSHKGFLSGYYSLLIAFLNFTRGKKHSKTAIKKLISNLAIESLLKYSKQFPDLTKLTCKSISEALTAANDSKLCWEILEKCVSDPGNFSFDEETGSKVVISITNLLGTEETKAFGNKCLDVLFKGDVTNKDRVNALNMYCNLLNKPSCFQETEWKVEGMKSLLTAGIVSKENVSSELAAIIRKSFFNLLSIKFPTLLAYSGALKELFKCGSSFLITNKPLRIKVSDAVRSSWKLSSKLTNDLEKSAIGADEGKKVVIQALQLLTVFIALKSIYEPKDSQFNLTDIESVFMKITRPSDESGDPEWIEVLMDLFLNMLSKPTVSNRNVINIVFKAVVSHLNENAFLQLVNVLDVSYDLKTMDNEESEKIGEEPEDEEDNESEKEESDSSESEDSDQSEDDGTEDSDDDETAIEDHSSDEDDDDDVSSKMFNQEKLQFELRKALTSTNDSDNESINIDDLNEEEGQQLDATLSAIFKSAMVKKKTSRKESVTSHFRTRVIDLLETYCLSGMPLAHWLVVIPTVLKLANSLVASKNPAGLKQRIFSFIKKISSAKILFTSTEDCDVNLLVELVQKLIKDLSCASGTVRDLKPYYLELIKFIIRNTSHTDSNNLESIKESLNDMSEFTVTNFFSEKSSLQLELLMFLCQYSWCGVHSIVRKIAEATFSPSTKPFKRHQGIYLLKGYFKSDRIFSVLTDAEVKSVKSLHKQLLEDVSVLNSGGSIDEKTQYLFSTLITDMCNSKCSSRLKWKPWKEQLIHILTEPREGKFSKAFKTMCEKLNMNASDFVHRENNSLAAGSSKKKKKAENLENQGARKRKQVDARKLKKESKRVRLAAMDGLENFSFTNMINNDNWNM